MKSVVDDGKNRPNVQRPRIPFTKVLDGTDFSVPTIVKEPNTVAISASTFSPKNLM